MSDDLIQVGRVAGAFGVRGELRLTSFTADPLALIEYRNLLREDGAPALTITSGRATKGSVVVWTAEVQTRDQAEALRGLKLYIRRADLPAPVGVVGEAVDVHQGREGLLHRRQLIAQPLALQGHDFPSDSSRDGLDPMG